MTASALQFIGILIACGAAAIVVSTGASSASSLVWRAQRALLR